MRDLDLILPDIAGIATYAAGASFGPRTMVDFEFVWMIEGNAEYRWGDQTVQAPQGSIVLCRPGAIDSFRWDPHRRTRHAFFHFRIACLPASWPRAETWPLVRMPPDGDLLRLLFRSFITWCESSPDVARLAAEQMLAAYVHDALSMRDIPAAPLPESVEKAWSSIKRQIDQDPAVQISLAGLAATAGVSPEHLCRQFTAATGRSPMRTVAQVRLDRAAMMVATGTEPIATVAERCGFANPFHFSRAFRRAFGRSPSQVRRDAQDHGITVSRLGVQPPRVRGR